MFDRTRQNHLPEGGRTMKPRKRRTLSGLPSGDNVVRSPPARTMLDKPFEVKPAHRYIPLLSWLQILRFQAPPG